MNNVVYLKDWLVAHADVSDCERALHLSDDMLAEAVSDSEDVLDALNKLINQYLSENVKESK